MSENPVVPNTFSAVIIDDEKRSHEAIKEMLLDVEIPVEVIASGYGIMEGIAIVQRFRPDILFLDIEMPDGEGFDLLEKVDRSKLSTIFISAHQSHAMRAVKFGGLDYLLKPFSTDELRSAIQNVVKHRQAEQQEKEEQIQIALEAYQKMQARELPTRFNIPTSDGILYKKVKDIIRLEAKKNYTEFSLVGESKKIIASINIGEYEDQFTAYPSFMRVHRSHLINLEFVDRYMRSDGGYLVMQDGAVVNVSKIYRDELLDRLDRV